MSEQQKSGCLFLPFGGRRSSSQPTALVAPPPVPELPQSPQYRVRSDFLSVSEMSFYLNLQVATRERYTVFPKVNLADLLFSPTNKIADKNRIDRKHLDFLLVDAATLQPALAIELDDSSHSRGQSRERDAVKDAALASAGFPLLRMRLRSYTAAEVIAAIDGATGGAAASSAQTPTASESVPICPSCRVPMVLRPAGPSYKAFYGCVNYPRCHQRVPVEDSRHA